MKVAPISVTDVLLVAAVVGGGVVLYQAYKTFASVKVTDVIDYAVSGVAGAVDSRAPDQNPDEFSFGGVQQAVSDAVRRGQDAGATNFFSAYFKGLFL